MEAAHARTAARTLAAEHWLVEHAPQDDQPDKSLVLRDLNENEMVSK